MSKPSISLCMIVKNEERWIKDCLESTKDIVDEWIIIDTGSTDHTIDICKRFGCCIHTYTWNDDFSSARNAGLEKANGDWILWLDADEVIDQKSVYIIKEAVKTRLIDAYTFTVINYYGAVQTSTNYSKLSQIRLFRNHIGLMFKNKIHETLNHSEKLQHDRLGILDVKIHHYGYLDEVVKSKKKSKRNIELLIRELAHNDTAWNRYYLAAEYYRLKEFAKALTYVNYSIIKFIQTGLKPASIVYKLKYSILTDLQRWKEAGEGIDLALLLYPDYVDLWFYKGLIQFNQQQFKAAVESFEKCIQLGEENDNYYIVHGVGSFQAWYYLGRCYKEIGWNVKAVDAFITTISKSQEHTEAIKYLGTLVKDTDFPLEEYINENIDEKIRPSVITLVKRMNDQRPD